MTMKLIEKIRSLEEVSAEDTLAICGSLPPNKPDAYYIRFIHAGRDSGMFVVVDTSGGPLMEALKGHPDLIKPNISEFNEMMAGALRRALGLEEEEATEEALSRAILKRPGYEALLGTIRSYGEEYPHTALLLSAGVSGAFYYDPRNSGEGIIHGYNSRKFSVQSTVGAGDCLLAGFLAKRTPVVDAIKLGVAAASVRCQTQLQESFHAYLDGGKTIQEQDYVHVITHHLDARGVREWPSYLPESLVEHQVQEVVERNSGEAGA
jgi:1-phosphofructokinase